jgi:hypothetical protein
MRRAAEKELGQLYKRVERLDLSKCAYCGDQRDVLDHVPPITYAYQYLDLKKFHKDGGQFLLYPCCNTCNELLGAKKLFDYPSRAAYLWGKYSSMIKQFSWDQEELQELGNNLKTIVLSYEKQRAEYIKKLRGVEDTLRIIEP